VKRREFISLVGGAAAMWPLMARAQQAVPTIGFLGSVSAISQALPVSAFRQGLSEQGFIEGQNVVIEFRWADGRYERLPALAVELVQRGVAVLAGAGGDSVALAAKSATTTIPIVFNTGTDPVQLGLVASLNRPAGNLTGISQLSGDLTAKRLQLARELVPGAAVIAILVNPNNPNTGNRVAETQRAARAIGIQLHVAHAGAEGNFEAAFADIARKRADALVVSPDPFLNSRAPELASLAARHAIPAVYGWPEYVSAGGLISYGTNLADVYRLVGTYTGRILKGEKPGDLPVQLAAKVQLNINLKTAKALNLDVPPALLARADEVIE
jgi:putative ABC transport system substrate-binding protein